jgi:tetratricopeptide (TPR) repeat protein
MTGKLAGMPKRDAQDLLRKHGGVAVERLDESVDLVVAGEEDLPLDELAGTGPAAGMGRLLADAERLAAANGRPEIIGETELWQRMGLVEAEQNIHRLYTPAMLARLLGVPVAVVRRWERRKLLVPVRRVRRLAYFDFQEVTTARRLAQLVAAGVSPQAIERQLSGLARVLPGIERPLAQLSVIVDGKALLLRQGDGLIEPGGQRRLDFSRAEIEAAAGPTGELPPDVLSMRSASMAAAPPATPEEMVALAVELEDCGKLQAAAEMCRAALAAGGPKPEICFQLAELLYQLNDLPAARERYYMAIELDEDYVEARANLGCVLAELGDRELAVAAFQGALAFHDEYADVHYHLARALEELNREEEAVAHWRRFTELAPESPWAAPVGKKAASERIAGVSPGSHGD